MTEQSNNTIEKTIIKTNPVVDKILVLLSENSMGDYYLVDVEDHFKNRLQVSDLVLSFYDNFEELQLEKAFKSFKGMMIGCNRGTSPEPQLEEFRNKIKTHEDYISSLLIDTYTPNGLMKFLDQVDHFLEEVAFKESLLEFTRDVLDAFGVDLEVTDKIIDSLSLNQFDINEYQEETLVHDRGTAKVISREEKKKRDGENRVKYSEEAQRQAIAEAIYNCFVNKIAKDKVITPVEVSPDELYAEVAKFLDSTLNKTVDTNKTQSSNTEEDVQEVHVEEVDEPEIIEEDISDEELNKVIATEALIENIESSNKMTSERALELVKDLNKKWLDQLFPNIMHKLDNINFFKSNINKYKINSGDKTEDVVAKVAGGVVHLELLKKNLSKWNNENENWKTEDNKTIKKNQKQWRREFVKFKNSLLESILPTIKSILNINEEPEIVDDEDSIDLVISNKTEPEIKHEEHNPNSTIIGDVANSISTESMEETTNIYNNMISLECLKEQVSNDDELFDLVLETENLENRTGILNKMSKFSIYDGTETKLGITASIQRRVKINNKKFN